MEPFSFDDFMDDYCHKKAALKYDIRLLESRLSLFLPKFEIRSIDHHEPKTICLSLSNLYELMITLHNKGLHPNHLLNNHSFLTASYQECIVQLERLRATLMYSVSLAEEMQTSQSLSSLYKRLAILFSEDSQTNASAHSDETCPVWVKCLLNASEAKAWLEAILLYANAGDETQTMDALIHLTDKQLQQLKETFSQQDIIQLIHTIFFYKLNPKNLLTETTFPEKFVSISQRLTLLYEHIESLHHNIQQALQRRLLPLIPDYLFHNEHVPEGIKLEVGHDYQQAIIDVITAWKLKSSKPMLQLCSRQIQEFFYAYKFWFNPNRLIDAAMALKQHINSLSDDSNIEFQEQLQSLFHALSTSECLDLYGYFANKDSRYLMRTLLAVQRGVWLPEISEKERKSVAYVFESIQEVMEVLRKELQERHIKTKPYLFTPNIKSIKPGKRNREAVLRVIRIYSQSFNQPSQKIDDLFALLEDQSV